MNAGWRMLKGKSENAYTVEFKDNDWQKVNLPNGLELLPVEASGCANYQGEAWYRKHFSMDKILKGKKLFLHFEAIMGKSKVWVNGKLLKEHFGGFLPVIVDITKDISFDKENVIAVWADNSDDPNYPPGKAQTVLDYSYFGGIYRDCWLVSVNPVYITDPNFVDKKADGGLFVAFDDVSEKQSTILLQLNVKNENAALFNGNVSFELYTAANQNVGTVKSKLQINGNAEQTIKNKLVVSNPELWSPDSPTLYHLNVIIKDKSGKIIDGYMRRVGIRSIEMKGEKGFYLNGKPSPKLMGVNRHQDFAVIGFALPNSVHWRDAKKMRDVGMEIIRNAHYPQDPAFMDACDELGLFVIVNTPGWQFWNNNGTFEQFVYSDIRNMVRRDRNHPSVIFWEPVLNETDYPDYFAKKTNDIVMEEFPFRYCYTASDEHAKGNEFFAINYGMPKPGKNNPNKTYFTREWGDNVDDWNSHNSTSRVSREWGEQPMLQQAINYANPSFKQTSYNSLFELPAYFFGGCLWHSFDHQRGYHPDPFYGGIMDAYRQPKTSYYMFQSERDPKVKLPLADSGPMVYIANIMTPFSDNDVTVFSNCEQVRLISFEKDTSLYTLNKKATGIPYPVITFKNKFDFMTMKQLHREEKQAKASLVAEGLIDGKVVASQKVMPSLKPTKIVLEVDNATTSLVADGSDMVVVVARITDDNGNVKRLNNSLIQFEIEGEGRFLSPPASNNIVKVEWGEAPILIQSTNKNGKITVRAHLVSEGSQRPIGGKVEITTLPTERVMIFMDSELPDNITVVNQATKIISNQELQEKIDILQKELNKWKLKEVEKQQTDFETTIVK
jgi:beta-galactosidase